MFRQNLKQAARVLAKSPGFTIAALAMLALGIGANTAIFSVVRTVLLKPLPFEQGDRLMYVLHRPPAASFPGMATFSVSIANYIDWRASNHSFEAMSALRTPMVNLTGVDRPESIASGRVEADFFPLLRAKPMLGRTFTPQENEPGHDQSVVISHKFWANRMGSDPGVLGKTLTLDGRKYSVIGVMPPSFEFDAWALTKAELWMPIAWDAKDRQVRGNHNYLVIARLKDGVTQQQAQAEMDAISTGLERAYPEENAGWGAVLLPLREDLFGDARMPLLVLLGAVGFILLIACANIANLLLARNLSRGKEMAIRSALGASRFRLAQQSLTETLLLAVTGGALGLLVAQVVLDLIQALVPELPRSNELKLDPVVLGIALALSLFTGFLAGLLPSLRFAKADVNEALKQGLGRTDADSTGRTTRSLLVTIEVALSLVLLAGAGLMVRTLSALKKVDPGLDPHNVITMSLRIPKVKYTEPARQLRFYEDVLRRVRALPGVKAAATVDTLPFSGGGSTQPITVEGRPAGRFAQQPEVGVRVASAGYLETMRIPLLQGRSFTEDDRQGKQDVVIISEAMARHFWPKENPIGKRLRISFTPERSREVVGVVANVKENGLHYREELETLYEPYAQNPTAFESIAVRTEVAPEAMVSAIVQAIREVDREQPVTDVKTMQERLDQSLMHHRFTMTLLTAFAALALLLALIGIYSVLAYVVKRRMREIGVRVALGAQARDILGMMLVDGVKPALAGIALGALAAVALGRLLANLLYEVSPADPLTLTAVSVLLALVACGACLGPAIRAMRVDPLQVLRDE